MCRVGSDRNGPRTLNERWIVRDLYDYVTNITKNNKAFLYFKGNMFMNFMDLGSLIFKIVYLFKV